MTTIILLTIASLILITIILRYCRGSEIIGPAFILVFIVLQLLTEIEKLF